jgi:predicted dehydrogenase
MLYFFRWEGIVNTFRKYFAHKHKQQRFLTFLVIEFAQKKYINISTQSQTAIDNFIINNKFYLYQDINYQIIAENVEYYMNKFNQFAETENYKIFNADLSDSISLESVPDVFEDKYNSGLFVYGLGGYVKMFVIHHFKMIDKLACIDYKASITKNFREKYGFLYGFNTPKSSIPVLKNTKRPIAIIATYHSDHSSLASEIHEANPNTVIFIEKPPTVTLDDLNRLINLYNQKANIEIGFNRRFIDYSRYVKEKVKDKTVIITCSVKEVLISSNHWYLWKNQGTRITGNAAHWFDLANWWIESKPIEINLLSNPKDYETSAISVLYQNGSILNITISDKGNSLRGVQEKLEIRFDNETIFIDDFISLTYINNDGRKLVKRKNARNKGHNSMYKNFLKIIDGKKRSDYTVFDLINTSVVTFYASEMLATGIKNMKIEDKIDHYSALVNNMTSDATI